MGRNRVFCDGQVFALDLLGFGRSSRPAFRSDVSFDDALCVCVESIERWRKVGRCARARCDAHTRRGRPVVETCWRARHREDVPVQGATAIAVSAEGGVWRGFVTAVSAANSATGNAGRAAHGLGGPFLRRIHRAPQLARTSARSTPAAASTLLPTTYINLDLIIHISDHP